MGQIACEVSCSVLFYFFKVIVFAYFWLCWVFDTEHGLSLVVEAEATLAVV